MGYGIKEVCEKSGLTKSQVEYLIDRGVVAPEVDNRGRGKRRIYSFLNLIELRACKLLLDLGLSTDGIRKELVGFRLLVGHVDGKKFVDEGSSTVLTWTPEITWS